MNIISNKLLDFRKQQQGGWCKQFHFPSLTSLLEAESTDFVALERIQQQVYIEVEGVAPGYSLTGTANSA